MTLNEKERRRIIKRLCKSYDNMSQWDQRACLHAMQVPSKNPETGEPFTSFREILECAADSTLHILLDDFADNGELLPEEEPPVLTLVK